MKGFVITPLTKKDMTAFRHYIGKAFHRKYILRDARYLKWQYSRFYIIRAGGSIVGHFGFRDVAYKAHDTTKRVRVLMNLYVLAPYRIFGVGTMLIKNRSKNILNKIVLLRLFILLVINIAQF